MKNSPHLVRTLGVLLFLAMPTSLNFEMRDFGFGAGGVGISDSGNYSLTGVAGEVSSGNLSGTSYDLGPGLLFTQQSNTPAAPTFTNPSNHYNKLKFVLDTGSNPSDTLFAIAISTDNFVTTNYVQADNTIGSSAVYQTYSTWGGASGAFVVGLTSNTTYKIKVKAIQTKYTESSFSAVATAATTTPSLSYDIDISTTDSETSSPYTLKFGTLNVGSVTTAAERIWIDLDSNAEYSFQVLEIDPVTKTATTFGSLDGSSKWIGGVLATNGKIYGTPFNSTTVLEIDPVAKTTTIFGSLTGSSKWWGGVLAPNGKIYGIPYDSTTVLESLFALSQIHEELESPPLSIKRRLILETSVINSSALKCTLSFSKKSMFAFIFRERWITLFRLQFCDIFPKNVGLPQR